jgi:hypothetical protein
MLIPLLSLSLSVLDAPQDNHVLEIFPLQHACGQRAQLVAPRWGTMLTFGSLSSENDRPDLLSASEGGPRFAVDSAAALLRSLHAADVNESRLRIESLGENLLVAGEADAVARLRGVVGELSALLARPLQVEAALWDGGDAPAVMGPQEFTRFAANRSPLWRAVADTYGGSPVALDHQRWTRYVRSVNAEVAQKASISNPRTPSAKAAASSWSPTNSSAATGSCCTSSSASRSAGAPCGPCPRAHPDTPISNCRCSKPASAPVRDASITAARSR